MNKIVVLMAKPLEFLPPVMSLLQTLREIGREPVFVGVKSKAGCAFLEKNGFEAKYIPYDSHLYQNNTFVTKIAHRLSRAMRFFPRRCAMRRVVADISSQHGGVTLWFAEIQSAALFGNGWKRYGKPIVTIYELADFRGRYWSGFAFREFLRDAIVVEPEVNRALEIQRHFKLTRTPRVVANKPSGHPRRYRSDLPVAVKEILIKASDRPIFLYQGVWTEDRADVGCFIEAIAKNRPDCVVLVMPGTEAVARLARRYPNIFILDYIPPPNHLAATSIATVGIAVYNSSGKTDLERKNALLCAPNKIYEYAGFGVPTLGNRVPGLIDTIERSGAGLCVEVNEKAILEGVDKLIMNIETYREAANRFFEDTNLDVQVGDVLQEAEHK